MPHFLLQLQHIVIDINSLWSLLYFAVIGTKPSALVDNFVTGINLLKALTI